MSKKLRIESNVRRLIHWIDDIEKGNIQVPKFQRDFVWDLNDIKDLFDSIKYGYPIGSILLWKPESESFDRGLTMGSFTLPKASNNFLYILDGFQRLSTFFGCLKNPYKDDHGYNEKEWKSKFNLFYDLDKEEFMIPRSLNSIEPYQVPLYELVDTKAAFSFQENLNEKKISHEKIHIYMERYAELGTSLIDYELPVINIDGGSIKEAVEIFSRVNSKGTDISPDWMISALTYNKGNDFRLGSLIDNLLLSLEAYNFHDISNGRDLILKCITHSFDKPYFDQSNKIEKLAHRSDFIEVARKTIISIEKAVKFLFEDLLVLNAKQLPYVPQLIFITDFFNTIDQPSPAQLKQLRKWFWVTTYSNYFTIYTISKQREAYKQFRRYLKGVSDEIVYNDKPDLPFKTAEFPLKINAGSVRSNALIIFLLNHSNNSLKESTKIRKKFEGMSLSYLFKDIKNDKNSFYPESVVPVIKHDNDKIPKFIELHSFAQRKDIDLDKYFFTQEMLVMLEREDSNSTKREVLKLRKEIIMRKEREFVKSLGLDYDDG